VENAEKSLTQKNRAYEKERGKYSPCGYPIRMSFIKANTRHRVHCTQDLELRSTREHMKDRCLRPSAIFLHPVHVQQKFELP
jgi:hypothetical protein